MDTSICSDSLIEDILLVDNMLLVTTVGNIYSIYNSYYEDDYEEEMEAISQIEVHLKDETVILAYISMTDKGSNKNQINEYFDNNGETLLLISIEDK